MITLEKGNKGDIKEKDIFAKNAWNQFNKENRYEWDEKKYYFVARENGRIVGFASFRINGGATLLSQLIISKKDRNKGIGGLLIKKVENFSKSKKCHVLYLETSEKHKGALKFYKNRGYKIVATLKNNKFHFDWYYLSKELK